MDFFAHHVLSVVLFTPLAGALLMLFIPRENELAHKIAGNIFGVLGFLVSLPLVRWFKPEWGGFTFQETADWIPSIGAKYHLGLDGISLLLVMLTTFLGMIAILSSWSAIHQRTKEYYILLLLLQTGMIGVFVSLDFFLFYVFWEVMLVPMYFLIGVWGSDRRLYAAIKFFLYTLAGSVVMLLAILALYFYAPVPAGGTRTFDVPTLLAAAQHFSDPLKVWLFWGFFFAFAIKVPMFPFHTWLPDAHTEAPTAGSVILAGVLLKMGTYGLLRFNLALFPETARKFAPLMITLAVIGIIYGALVAMVQPDVKRLVAYSSVSHMGFVVLGLFSFTELGMQGALYQMLNHGVSTGALFLFVGFIYERRHTRLISEFGGLAKPMPWFSTLFVFASLSSIGLPFLNGFVGEFLILIGTWTSSVVSHPWIATMLAGTGVIWAAVYMLWMLQRVVFGTKTSEANSKLSDLNLREAGLLLPLLALMLFMGVYPSPFLKRSSASLEATRAHLLPLQTERAKTIAASVKTEKA